MTSPQNKNKISEAKAEKREKREQLRRSNAPPFSLCMSRRMTHYEEAK